MTTKAGKSKRPPSQRKGISLGDRVTVPVGKDKNGKALYSFMLRSVAEYFGFPGQGIATKQNKFGESYVVRGTKGNSIKVNMPKKASKSAKPANNPKPNTGKSAGSNAKTSNGVLANQKSISIPFPPDMTVPKIAAFLATAKKNKPTSFVSAGGTTYPVSNVKPSNNTTKK